MTALEIDALLAGFRDWLMRTVAVADSGSSAVPAPDDVEPPDLYSLLSQLTALRQEVNLQTRASRAQQEQSAETLRQLTDALAALEDSQQATAESARQEQPEQLRPLLKAMAEAHDALALARREVQRIQETLAPLLEAPGDLQPPPPPRLPLLARWLGFAETVTQMQQDHARRRNERDGKVAAQLQAVRRLVESIITGYAMSLQRLERALDQHGLEPIPCVGEPFDPETMEVVEVVHETGGAASEVIEEVRRGYRWRGRMFRCAQVKVIRPPNSAV